MNCIQSDNKGEAISLQANDYKNKNKKRTSQKQKSWVLTPFWAKFSSLRFIELFKNPFYDFQIMTADRRK